MRVREASLGQPGRPVSRLRVNHPSIPRQRHRSATTVRQVSTTTSVEGFLSIALHSLALAAFAAACGGVCQFLLLIGFWPGVVLGIVIYGAIVGVIWFGEDDDNKEEPVKLLNHQKGKG